MNKFQSVTKSLRWFMALLVVVFVAGCGGGSGIGVAPSSTKAITAYSLVAYPAAVVTINEPLKTIAVVVPSGTPVTALVATFTSTGTGSPTVGGVPQMSGTTVNNFTLPKPYIVTAADGTTATYTVTVSYAPISSKGISSFSFAAYSGSVGTITGSASPFAIAVTVPFGTVKTNLVATFATTGASVTVAAAPQTSGTTVNDFTTAPVAYLVTAVDGTTAIYNVTVTVAANSAKAISSYSFATIPGAIGIISGSASPFAIAVTVPNGTSLTGLDATFAITGASVTVGGVTQTSGTTLNNFPAAPSSLAYTVHAVDSTTAVYNVTVTIAAAASTSCTGGASCVPLGNAGSFTILGETMITDTSASSITGNIGVSPAAGSTMTVPCASMLTGKAYQVDDTFADPACSLSGTVSSGVNKTFVDTAVANMVTAYNNAAGQTVSVPADSLGTAGDISGLTFTPGVYKWTTAVQIQAGNPHGISGGDTTGITLDCTTGGSSSVFVFQISGTLTEGLSATPAHINLTGGCLASNIFWQTTSDVTILVASVFKGNILTATQVVMQDSAVLHGRALAQTAVTLIHDAVGP